MLQTIPCCIDEFSDILDHQHSGKVKSDRSNRQNDGEAVGKIPIVRPEIVLNSIQKLIISYLFAFILLTIDDSKLKLLTNSSYLANNVV